MDPGGERRLFRACDGPLELGLAHLRPPLDVEPTRLLHQLVARGLIAALHRVGLLAQGALRAAGQVLERLVLASAALRLLDVALCRLALLGSRHSHATTPRRGRPTGCSKSLVVAARGSNAETSRARE